MVITARRSLGRRDALHYKSSDNVGTDSKHSPLLVWQLIAPQIVSNHFWDGEAAIFHPDHHYPIYCSTERCSDLKLQWNSGSLCGQYPIWLSDGLIGTEDGNQPSNRLDKCRSMIFLQQIDYWECHETETVPLTTLPRTWIKKSNTEARANTFLEGKLET